MNNKDLILNIIKFIIFNIKFSIDRAYHYCIGKTKNNIMYPTNMIAFCSFWMVETMLCIFWSELFAKLIQGVAAKSPEGQVVLLVDEYDHPLGGLFVLLVVTGAADQLGTQLAVFGDGELHDVAFD